MKKIISLVFSFLFVFNFVSNVFSSQVYDIDLNNFDNFSIEQVQKTFSNTLSQEQKTNTQDTVSDFLTLNDLNFNLNNNVQIKKANSLSNLFFELSSLHSLNYVYKYKLFENICGLNNNSGITQHKIKFNSYIAVVLFDTNSVLNYYI